MAGQRLLICACAYLLLRSAVAHEHLDEPAADPDNLEPVDAILWAHVLVQLLAWGLLFPTGMVLGLAKSRWHVPVQVLGACLAILGNFLGHAHKGRQFGHTAHASFAPWLNCIVIAQVAVGAYLRLHWTKGLHHRIRLVFSLAHRIVGASVPVMSWCQFLLGAIALLGFCQDDHLGQCLAHFIMGSAFIAYGTVLLIIMLLGQVWLQRTGRSQEFFDSAVIAAWGCVNTFTEHRWGSAWVHNDLQHTSLGVVWWCAGLLGMWLSVGTDGRARRNLIPAIVIFVTGYAMSAHPQTLKVSAMTHSVFGYTLMGAAMARIIEISIILKDAQALSMDGTSPNSFQYLTPLLLFAGGFIFMSANEEQMALLNNANVDHVAWLLFVFSFTFFMFLYVNVLIRGYAIVSRKPVHIDVEALDLGVPTAPHNDQPALRDVADFELDVLTDNEGDDEHATLMKRSS